MNRLAAFCVQGWRYGAFPEEECMPRKEPGQVVWRQATLRGSSEDTAFSFAEGRRGSAPMVPVSVLR